MVKPLTDLADRVASPEEVFQRIEARYAAELIASMADEEAQTKGKHVWKCLHDICCAHVPCKVQEKELEEKHSREMSPGEARSFEGEAMPFGEFAGTLVGEVPIDRLEWYADQRFIDELRRYLCYLRKYPNDGD